MIKKCPRVVCIIHILAKLANIIFLLCLLYWFSQAYGPEKFLALWVAIPSILSLIALKKGGDREERHLKSRIRKAKLRKELSDLKQYDEEK